MCEPSLTNLQHIYLHTLTYTIYNIYIKVQWTSLVNHSWFDKTFLHNNLKYLCLLNTQLCYLLFCICFEFPDKIL